MAIPSQGFMVCSKCGVEKSRSEMCSNALKTKGTWRCCKDCANNYSASYRYRNRDAFREYHREWRKKQGKRLSQYMVARRAKKVSAMTKSERIAFNRVEADKVLRYNAVLKEQVFTAYGGWICACCKETERKFLTIDHVLNNAAELRKNKTHGHSTMYYRWLRKSGYPKDFQVLCMNCNFGKRMNNGICPHKSKV